MEQKVKRIGKFNIIDIIAVVLILAVIAFFGVKVLGSGNDDQSAPRPMVDVTFVVKAEGVATDLYENIQDYLPCRLMASGALLTGRIESMEKKPYYVMSPEGEWVEDPMHVNLYFTVTTQTLDTDVMTTKIGEQEVRIGKADYILKSEFIEIHGGTIVDVTWGE